MTPGGGGLPRLHRLWWLACLALAASLVAVRELHYLRREWPAPAERGFDALMHASLHSVIVASLTLPAQAAAGLALLAGLAIRPRWLAARGERGWQARPWVHSVAWTGLALNNYLLDVNPFVARASLASVIVLPIRNRHRIWSPVLMAGFFAAWALASPTLTDALAVVLWSALFLALAGAAGRIADRDRLWLGVSASAVCQLAAAVLPLVLPLHHGVKVADGMAYGFCERDEDGRIFAVVPGSGWGPDAFLSGRLDEISAATLSVEEEHRPFDRRFRGRAIAPLCLPDTLQVAMAQTQIGTSLQLENVMELSADGSRVLRRSLFGGEMGQTLFRDRERDAVFYASEWSNRIYRLDRRTGAVDRDVGRSFIPSDQHHWFFFGRRYPGSLVLTTGPDSARRSFVAAHWTTGSTAYEIDLDTLQLRSRIEARHGGTSAVSVDEAYHRLFLCSPWGLDVFDLETGRPQARLRTGFGCRTAVVDASNDLVYVPTTIEGRLRVLERRSLRLAGVIDIGLGPRNAFVSSRAGALLAGTSRAYYYWKSADLARHFAPAGVP